MIRRWFRRQWCRLFHQQHLVLSVEEGVRDGRWYSVYRGMYCRICLEWYSLGPPPPAVRLPDRSL